MPRRLPPLLRRDVVVTLTCGCQVRIHDKPRWNASKFSCPNGRGHGYNLGWTKWSDLDGSTSAENPLNAKET
jgi:hypothetical protein